MTNMARLTKPAGFFMLAVAASLAVGASAKADFLVTVSNNTGTVNEVEQYTDNGTYVGDFVPNSFPANGGLSTPEGIAYGPDGNVYVASYANGYVLEYNGANGTYLGAFASTPQMVESVIGLQFGPNGNLYTTNFNSTTGTSAIQEFDGPNTGTPGALVATFNVPAGDGTPGNGVTNPLNLTFGPTGNLLVSSSATNEVYQYNATTGALISVLVPATGVLVPNFPDGLAVDAVHNILYVSSSFGGQILEYNATTVAPIGTFATLPGPGSSPSGLLIQPNGDILVSAIGLGEVLQYSPTGVLLNTIGYAQMGGAGLGAYPTYIAQYVPEPSSIALAGMGFAVVGATTYRRRRTALTA